MSNFNTAFNRPNFEYILLCAFCQESMSDWYAAKIAEIQASSIFAGHSNDALIDKLTAVMVREIGENASNQDGSDLAIKCRHFLITAHRAVNALTSYWTDCNSRAQAGRPQCLEYLDEKIKTPKGIHFILQMISNQQVLAEAVKKVENDEWVMPDVRSKLINYFTRSNKEVYSTGVELPEPELFANYNPLRAKKGVTDVDFLSATASYTLIEKAAQEPETELGAKCAGFVKSLQKDLDLLAGKWLQIAKDLEAWESPAIIAQMYMELDIAYSSIEGIHAVLEHIAREQATRKSIESQWVTASEILDKEAIGNAQQAVVANMAAAGDEVTKKRQEARDAFFDKVQVKLDEYDVGISDLRAEFDALFQP